MVIDKWRASGLGSGTMEVYLVWVRRYRAHCRAQGLDEIVHLTRAYATSFAQAYRGRRRGVRVKMSYRAGALHAVRAWACALRTLGEAVPHGAHRSRLDAGLSCSRPTVSTGGPIAASHRGQWCETWRLLPISLPFCEREVDASHGFVPPTSMHSLNGCRRSYLDGRSPTSAAY